MCSLVLSEKTVRFIQAMMTLPAVTHEKIGVFINLASEGDKRATKILRMVGDDEIRPGEGPGLLDEYLESGN